MSPFYSMLRTARMSAWLLLSESLTFGEIILEDEAPA